MRTTHVRVSACNLMISSRNFDDAGSTGRGDRGRGREGWGGAGDGNARPEERTSERGRELVRAGAFPLANSRARDGRRERQRDWNEGEREKENEGEKKVTERERGEGNR